MSKSFTEEFKDQKINDLLEDYIALEKEMKKSFNAIESAINETPQRFDAVISEKIKTLINSAQDINKEILDEKLEIKEIGSTVKEKLSSDILDLMSSLKSAQEKNNQTYIKQLESISNASKPFSASKVIAICAVCTIFLSAAFSGAFWYVAQSQKEQELQFYASGYTDMQKLTKETIALLPKEQQKIATAKLETLENRSK
ncbi:hypothetical protein A4O59_004294 [Salmonella enterica subsp. enterica]|nr:hypothetical protein [Salmonella enterica subsp. enterica]